MNSRRSFLKSFSVIPFIDLAIKSVQMKVNPEWLDAPFELHHEIDYPDIVVPSVVPVNDDPKEFLEWMTMYERHAPWYLGYGHFPPGWKRILVAWFREQDYARKGFIVTDNPRKFRYDPKLRSFVEVPKYA